MKEREAVEAVNGIDKVGFLFVNNVVCGSKVFKTTICLVGLIDGEERASRLTVSENGEF